MQVKYMDPHSARQMRKLMDAVNKGGDVPKGGGSPLKRARAG
jgi:hypothetical protein